MAYEIWADWFQYHEEGKGLINVSVTKALAAAGDYSAEDVLSENVTTGTAWTFSGVVKQNGCSGEITKAQAICETTGLTPRLTLYLFTATPTSQLNDNVTNTAMLHADLANYIGKIDFPAMEDLGTGDSETLATPSTYGKLPLAFNCASGANDLYGILVTRDAITGEVATMDMTINLTIEQTYLGEDLTGDVKSIHFGRGKSGELGKAEVGNLSLTLNNSSGNYSPSNSAGDYYGYLKPKRVVGVRAYDDDYNYQLFYGFVEEIVPHPHLSEQDAIITAVDGIDFLARHDMATALYKDSKTGTIHDYILTDAGWLKLARLDDGQDTIPYWYGHDIKSQFAQEEIDDSEQGFSYIDGFGYFNFEDRWHRSSAEHQTSQATFNNTMSYITYSLNPKNIYNIIKVTVTPWELQANAELWRLAETSLIDVGNTLTWWGDASISGESVFVDEWTTPTPLAYSSPTGFVDPGSKWADEANTYDENMASYSSVSFPGYYLELTIASVICDRIRIYADSAITEGWRDPDVNVDVYYNSEWHNIHSGIITRLSWEEILIGSSQAVTAARIKFNSISLIAGYIYEFDFYGYDYTANSAADGSGTDMTSDISITTTKFAKTIKIEVSNNGTVPTYITLLKARGTYYNPKTAVTRKAEDSTSQNDYQKRTLEIDGKYMTNATLGQDLANYAIGKYKEPRAELGMSLMNQDSTTLAQILSREISDRITVVNTLLGINEDYFIDYLEHDISLSRKLHTVTYHLADTINEDFWCLDFSALASSTTEGQTKLGY